MLQSAFHPLDPVRVPVRVRKYSVRGVGLRVSGLFILGLLILGSAMPARAQEAAPDEAESMVRINRLENMMRQMQGQIEELQFANQKLQEQLKFMLQNGEPRTVPQANSPTPQPAPQPKLAETPLAPPAMPQPQQNSGPINLLAAGNAPVQPKAQPVPPSGPGAPPMTLDQAAAAAAAGRPVVPSAPAAPAPAPAPVQPAEKRTNFEIAKDLIAAKDYERAANVLTGIVEGNPSEPKIPDALMLLGDTQFKLKSYAEAAQRYLKLAQTYPKHPEAPMAFVRLGLSLNEMGQKQQACATFAEFAKRYPNAKAPVKSEADRGRKAASCG